MISQEGTILSLMDRVITKSSPLINIIDFLASRILPKTNAKAGCQGNNYYCGSRQGPYCYTECVFDGYKCRQLPIYIELVKYDTTGTDCQYGTNECDNGCNYWVTYTGDCGPCPT